MPWDFEISPPPSGTSPTSARQPPKTFFPFSKHACVAPPDPTAFGKAPRGDLRGYWRYRVKDYRILCRIEHRRIVVVVISVGHRSTIYED